MVPVFAAGGLGGADTAGAALRRGLLRGRPPAARPPPRRRPRPAAGSRAAVLRPASQCVARHASRWVCGDSGFLRIWVRGEWSHGRNFAGQAARWFDGLWPSGVWRKSRVLQTPKQIGGGGSGPSWVLHSRVFPYERCGDGIHCSRNFLYSAFTFSCRHCVMSPSPSKVQYRGGLRPLIYRRVTSPPSLWRLTQSLGCATQRRRRRHWRGWRSGGGGPPDSGAAGRPAAGQAAGSGRRGLRRGQAPQGFHRQASAVVRVPQPNETAKMSGVVVRACLKPLGCNA